MTNKTVVLIISAIIGISLLTGCGESVNYDKAKQQAGEQTTEYLLHVRGMT